MAAMVEDKEALLAETPEATNPEFNMFAADGVAPPEGHAVDIAAKAAAGEAEAVTADAAGSGDGLAFVNVTSAGTQQAGEDEPAVAGGSAGSVWARVVTQFQSAKAVKESMTKDLAPWASFCDRTKFSVPSKTEVFSRVKANLGIYHANYCMLLGALAIWTAVSNLYFVLAMASSVGAYYYYRTITHDGSTFVFRGREVSAIQFYFFLTAFTLLLFWLTGGGSTMFWMVISAAGVVIGHASAREVEDQELITNAHTDMAMGALSGLNALRGV